VSNFDHMSGTGHVRLYPSPPCLRLPSVTESFVLPPDPSGANPVPESHTRPEPSLLPIERPRRPKCQSRMMWLGSNPVPAIPICEPSNARNAITYLVAEDPLNNTRRRLDGELKPPE
jgi:hypothetical protein